MKTVQACKEAFHKVDTRKYLPQPSRAIVIVHPPPSRRYRDGFLIPSQRPKGIRKVVYIDKIVIHEFR